MNFQIDTRAVLDVLRRYDQQCQTILDSSNKVKIYNYDKVRNNWVVQDESEGALYLVKRLSAPQYKFVILTKYNKPGSYPSTSEIAISAYFQSQIHQLFYMFKNELGVIQAISFPNKIDCDRISVKVEKIISELKVSPTQITSVDSRPKFFDNLHSTLHSSNANPLTTVPIATTPPAELPLSTHPPNEDRILNLLESARQRYKDNFSISDMSPITAGIGCSIESKSRQIDINELFRNTSVMQQQQLSSGSSKLVEKSTASTASRIIEGIDPIQSPTRPGFPKSRIFSESVDESNPSSATVKNGPSMTLTVTELERKLVQDASCNSIISSHRHDIDDDDDDSQLLEPQMFEKQNPQQLQHVSPLLSKDQLRDALIFLLQNDEDGRFISSLHSAYMDVCKKQARNSVLVRK